MSTISIQNHYVGFVEGAPNPKRRPAPLAAIDPASAPSSPLDGPLCKIKGEGCADVLFLKQLTQQISELNQALCNSPELTVELSHETEDITKQLVNPKRLKENLEQHKELPMLKEQIERLCFELNKKKSKHIDIAIDTLKIAKEVLFKSVVLKKEANESLGIGGFGLVHHAKIFGKSYAKKTIRKSKEKKLVEECQNTQKFSHPNLIKVVHADDDAIYFEYAKHGTSLNAVNLGLFPSYLEFEKFIFQVADGLDYMHQKGFVHKDIKPENILVAEDLSAKICDFATLADSSTFSYSEDLLTETSIFSSPEHLRGELNSENCFKLDVWGFGMFLWHLLKNDELYSPFIDDFSPKGEVGEDFCMKVLVKDEPFSKGEIHSHLDSNKVAKLDPNGKLVSIIFACLSLSADERPTMHEIKKMLG